VTPSRIVLMGVAGSGKSVVGEALARNLAYGFIDADDLHPVSNVEKMASGHPLDDEDRWPWLDAVGAAISRQDRVVAACSALAWRYRERLRASAPDLLFVHLDGSRAVLAERLGHRTDHFMPPTMLASQLDTLEPLGADEAGFVVDVTPPLEGVVRAIVIGLERVA
jgi:carbohydrate kinase (thermoresistant glucokinase family)